jgi:hypothetical protein
MLDTTVSGNVDDLGLKESIKILPYYSPLMLYISSFSFEFFNN